MSPDLNPLFAWLQWYRDAGADECIGTAPVDRLAAPAATQAVMWSGAPARSTAPEPARGVPAGRGGTRAVESARELAAGCASLDQLGAALAAFEGCALKDTAISLCYADGSATAELMLIGEAPGAEEDRLGRPFVGPSGQLLDRMLATIGLDRSRVWITNLIFWRPPGNRAPTSAEIATCLPFLERQIELLRPRLIVFLGGAAARALLGVNEGVTKLRGRRFVHVTGAGDRIPALITFHPAYLLRQPGHKRFAWRDLLAIRELLARTVEDQVNRRYR